MSVPEKIAKDILELIRASGLHPVPAAEQSYEGTGVIDPLVTNYSKISGSRDPQQFWSLMIGYHKNRIWLYLNDTPESYQDPNDLVTTMLTYTVEALDMNDLYKLCHYVANGYQSKSGERVIPVSILLVDEHEEVAPEDDLEWNGTVCAASIPDKQGFELSIVAASWVEPYREHLLVFGEDGIAVVSIDDWTNFGAIIHDFPWESVVEVTGNEFITIKTEDSVYIWRTEEEENLVLEQVTNELCSYVETMGISFSERSPDFQNKGLGNQ